MILFRKNIIGYYSLLFFRPDFLIRAQVEERKHSVWQQRHTEFGIEFTTQKMSHGVFGDAVGNP